MSKYTREQVERAMYIGATIVFDDKRRYKLNATGQIIVAGRTDCEFRPSIYTDEVKSLSVEYLDVVDIDYTEVLKVELDNLLNLKS